MDQFVFLYPLTQIDVNFHGDTSQIVPTLLMQVDGWPIGSVQVPEEVKRFMPLVWNADGISQTVYVERG